MKKSSGNSAKDRIFAEINLGTIERNYKLIKGRVGKDVEVLCVVKADAYGHGMIHVSKRLYHSGCNFFGVSSVNEGIEMRKAGIGGKILILGGIFSPDGIKSLVSYNLTPVIHELESLRKIIDFAKKSKRDIVIHVKFDTGMGRLGFMPEEAGSLIDLLKNEPRLHIEGIMSHFSESEKRNGYGLKQVDTFENVLRLFGSYGIKPVHIHMANTGGIINYPEAYFNMVRVGIGLYGSYPSRELEGSLGVEEAFSLKSRIAYVKEFGEGFRLSYGGTFVTKRRTRIGFIPCGYSDGYRRGLSNCAYVIVKEKRCPVVGRICMDWTLIDITDVNAEKGDTVILLGKTEKERITAWELADKLNTIPYEIFCGISKDVRRYYI
ncbi:MAG: alanine racemase [Deltaproteobacteria bacterium]|nr:alanine racemase [Deltaproteobacteria bacterium]